MVKYKFYKDQKMIGTILILSALLFQVFAFVKVPFFTTLHSYTVGLVFGSFNIIFYLYVIGEGFRLLLGDKFVKPQWLKISRIAYWIIAWSLMLVIVAWGHYYSTVFKAQRNLLGGQVFVIAFKDDWWSHFTKTPWWEPTDWWGGISGALLFSSLGLIMTTTGTSIVATLFLIITLSLALTGKPVALYTKSLKRSAKTMRHNNQKGIQTAAPPHQSNPRLLSKTLQEKSASIALIRNEPGTVTTPNGVLKTPLEHNAPWRLQTDPQRNVASDNALNKAQETTKQRQAQLAFEPLDAALLNDLTKRDPARLNEEIRHNVKKLTGLFNHFKIAAQVRKTLVGPTLTKYIIEPAPGINLKKFNEIESNLKMTLAAPNIRLELPIPGEAMIGIEVPNAPSQMVAFKDIFEVLSVAWKKAPLAVALGKNMHGKPLIIELNKTPHLLIAGATGAGKAGVIHALILSIIMRTSPNLVKFILIDLKMVAFRVYQGIPHLYAPIITDRQQAALVLQKLVVQMAARDRLMARLGVKNIAEYNAQQTPKMPYIITIIDELAALMNGAPKLVEVAIQRLAEKAHAVGIHLIIATQRPSSDVVTDLIKANIPARIAFAVASSIASKVILDEGGAEKLLGRGDMLIALHCKSVERAQAAFLTNEEIERVTAKLKKMGPPDYEINAATLKGA